MDLEHLETNVCVHSPVIEYSIGEGYYTSYAIHLTSNNPCFNRRSSHVRRRYSEFTRLRELLASHHPSLTPPVLPPKSFFSRFNDDFIEHRMKGLQKFLEEVLATPVYLSDKSLHMFLQSNSSMSEISKQCLGDIPAPPLVDSSVLESYYYENKSKRCMHDREVQHYERLYHHLDSSTSQSKEMPQITVSRTANLTTPDVGQSPPKKGKSKPLLIAKRNGSLDSSTGSSPSCSPSSYDTSDSSFSERSKGRRVSFNDRVKVAVVTRCGISVLRP